MAVETVSPRVLEDGDVKAALHQLSEVATSAIDACHFGSALGRVELAEWVVVVRDELANCLLGIPV